MVVLLFGIGSLSVLHRDDRLPLRQDRARRRNRGDPGFAGEPRGGDGRVEAAAGSAVLTKTAPPPAPAEKERRDLAASSGSGLGPTAAVGLDCTQAVRPQTGKGRSDGWLSIQSRDGGGQSCFRPYPCARTGSSSSGCRCSRARPIACCAFAHLSSRAPGGRPHGSLRRIWPARRRCSGSGRHRGRPSTPELLSERRGCVTPSQEGAAPAISAYVNRAVGRPRPSPGADDNVHRRSLVTFLGRVLS
jgi:hypothetical protein